MQKPRRRKLAIRLLWTFVIFFLLLNLITYIHAYRFTHFSNANEPRTTDKLTTSQKLKLLFTGIKNPRPVNKHLPSFSYQTIKIKSNVMLETWLIKPDSAQGTVILFHGYGGEKSSLLDKANEFIRLHFNVMMVDFMGSGGSEGIPACR